MRILNLEDLKAAVTGGSILSAGGGGTPQQGRDLGELAVRLGPPRLMELDELPEGALVAIVSTAGSVHAPDSHLALMDHVRAVQLLQEAYGEPIAGLVTAEVGAASVTQGWLQAAVLGIPVVDAPCGGRAHPVASMSALGLQEDAGYRSVQAAVGGSPEGGRRVELAVSGHAARTAAMVRAAAVEAGGAVAVASTPVGVSLLRERAAPGAIGFAISVGQAVEAARAHGARAMIDAAVSYTGGEIVAEGRVTDVRLRSEGGYDLGAVSVDAGERYDLTLCRVFMLLERAGVRAATFPDLITLLSPDTGEPVTIADIRLGQRVAILTVPADRLNLGAGARDPACLREVEEIMGRSL